METQISFSNQEKYPRQGFMQRNALSVKIILIGVLILILLIPLAIPQAERPLLPLLADGSEVLWLWGCGFAEGCAPDEYTHEVLTVRTEKTGEA